MTSYANLISQLRSLLRESNASTWTDDELALWLTNAEQWLASWLMSTRGSRRFRLREQFTIPPNTDEFDLTTLSKADGVAGDFFAIRSMSMLYTQTWQPMYPMQEGDENLYELPKSFKPSPAYVPSYDLRDETLIVQPTAEQTRTYQMTYNWLPVRKTKAGTSETPTRYDDMLLRRAAFDALGPIGQAETTFEQKYATRLDEIETYEINRHNRGTPEVVKNVTSRALFPYR